MTATTTTLRGGQQREETHCTTKFNQALSAPQCDGCHDHGGAEVGEVLRVLQLLQVAKDLLRGEQLAARNTGALAFTASSEVYVHKPAHMGTATGLPIQL